MTEQVQSHISTFSVLGINYRKTDAAIRGRYSINNDQYAAMLQSAKGLNIPGLMVLSTCNRTEVYGFTEDLQKFSDILCRHTSENQHEVQALAYHYAGTDAVDHLLQVASGLDSQILGDYEIVGQLRQSAKFARENCELDATFDRILNGVMNTAKKVRTQTRLSHGTVSVSFAAVQSIRQNFPGITNLNILLVGTGKIGQNTFKNIRDYLPGSSITLVNRNIEKAKALVGNRDIVVKGFHCLEAEIEKADVVIVATAAPEPIISSATVKDMNGFRLFIDLSIPFNIDPSIATLSSCKLINVDQLSLINDETLAVRRAEIPKAKAIISEQLKELVEWQHMRKHVGYINHMRGQLEHIVKMNAAGADPTKCPYHNLHNHINGMMARLKENKNHGCVYLETMQSFISNQLN